MKKLLIRDLWFLVNPEPGYPLMYQFYIAYELHQTQKSNLKLDRRLNEGEQKHLRELIKVMWYKIM